MVAESRCAGLWRMRHHGLTRLYPTSNPKLWGPPHPSWTGRFPAEPSALWTESYGGDSRSADTSDSGPSSYGSRGRTQNTGCSAVSSRGIWLNGWLWRRPAFFVLRAAVFLPWPWPAAPREVRGALLRAATMGSPRAGVPSLAMGADSTAMHRGKAPIIPLTATDGRTSASGAVDGA